MYCPGICLKCCPPDKVPRSPFFLHNDDESEKVEEFPFVRRSGGLSNEGGRYYYWSFNYWKSCVWWVCYNQIYLIDKKYLFKNFYWKSFREAEDYYNTWIMSNIGKWMIWHVRLSEAALLSKCQKLKSIHRDANNHQFSIFEFQVL